MQAIMPGMVDTSFDDELANLAEPISEEVGKFRYGEIEFEETGTRVPYLIIPATEDGKDPKKIVEYMRAHLRFNGKELSKPNIAFGVRARGKSYLEWAEAVYENDFLSQLWSWRTCHAEGLETDVLSDVLDDREAMIELIVRHEARLQLQDEASLRVELESMSLLNVRRRAQEGKVIPPHKQFKPTGLNGKLERVDMDTLYPGHHMIVRATLDDAIRQFGDTLISVFRDVVQGVVNSEGWFMFPAGRRPRHQLIGDTVRKYGGDLNDCVMVQYNSLQNPNLVCRGSSASGKNYMDHEQFVDALKHRSVPLQPFSKETPVLTERVWYPSEQDHFPGLTDIQGNCYDADGQLISVSEWVKNKCGQIGELDISLHPKMTHLLLWDLPGTRRGGGQCLPWTEVDKLHRYLNSSGVAEGCLICNGDQADLNNATSYVAQSTPVITIKSVGGASEFLAQLFETRQVGGPNDTGRKAGYQPRFPQAAMETQFQSVYFVPPEDVDERELIVVDAKNPDVGKRLQKEMAELLTMQGASEEKMLGFAASEKARLGKAWAWSLLYHKNSAREKMLADMFTYLMLLLNLTVVCLVVLKTVLDKEQCAEEAIAGALDDIQLSTETGAGVFDAQDALGVTLVVLPIVSGVLMTFHNAFNPIQKYNALRWASQSCESEIYTYRCRAKQYSAVVATGGWAAIDLEDEVEGEEKQASKKFVDTLAKISTQLRSETQMQNSSMAYIKDEDTEEIIDKKVRYLDSRTCLTETDEVVKEKDLEVLRLGLANADGVPSDQDLLKLRINQPRIGKAMLVKTTDDGFSQLNADEYLAVRTKPALEAIKHRLPPISRRKEILQALTYIATGSSVLLGTLGLDLYIAVTTATVSALTGMIEYQKLQETIVSLNNSVMQLTHLLMWWDSLSFVEKRMAKHRDMLVTTTESAILNEVNLFYQKAEEADHAATEEITQGNSTQNNSSQ